jgi:hypothetical protein
LKWSQWNIQGPGENDARKKPEAEKKRSNSLSVVLEDVFNYAYFKEKIKLTL